MPIPLEHTESMISVTVQFKCLHGKGKQRPLTYTYRQGSIILAILQDHSVSYESN